MVILAPPGLLIRIQRKTKIPSNKENQRREENRAADCHLRAVEPIIRVALLPILDIGLPYTDTEKFIPWPDYIMIPSEHQRIIRAPPSVVSSPRLQ